MLLTVPSPGLREAASSARRMTVWAVWDPVGRAARSGIARLNEPPVGRAKTHGANFDRGSRLVKRTHRDVQGFTRGNGFTIGERIDDQSSGPRERVLEVVGFERQTKIEIRLRGRVERERADVQLCDRQSSCRFRKTRCPSLWR